MIIKVYGKAGCGKCESAKKNIKSMGFKYSYKDISGIISGQYIPEDWRERDHVEIMADYTFFANLPIIKIDNEPGVEYSVAMKQLKAIKAANKVVEVAEAVGAA